MILIPEKIKELTEYFLSEHSTKLACPSFEFDEVVLRHNDDSSNIYIPKDGVFKIGIPGIANSDVNTLGFYFPKHFIAPISSFFPYVGAILELKSIANNITKNKINSIYKISHEEYSSLVGDDEMMLQLPAASVYNNFDFLFRNLATLRKKRQTEEMFIKMYNDKHPILHSGIAEKYIAEYFGITITTLKTYYKKLRKK